MASAIDATKPEAGAATTASVRAQFATAKAEIEALQLVAAPIQAGTAYALIREASGATLPEMAPVKLYSGAGTPEGSQTANLGDLYHRSSSGLLQKTGASATNRGWAGLLTMPGAPPTGAVKLALLPNAGETITATRNGVPVVYEWRPASPPAGGTAGRIWVYVGAAVADARTNILNAFNGIVDAPNITYNAVAPHPFLGTQEGLFGVLALATAAGGDPIPYDGLTCTLATTMVGAGNVVYPFVGAAQPAPYRAVPFRVTLNADHIAAGSIYLRLPKPFIAAAAMGNYSGPGGSGAVGVTITNSFGNCLLTIELGAGAIAGDLLDLIVLGL